MTGTRRSRDEPQRTGPIRNAMLPPQGAPPAATGAAAAFGAVIDERVQTATRIMDGAAATMQGAVERGVDTAYAVIDEYMLRGRQAAQRYQHRSPGDTMSDNRPQDPWTNGPMAAMMGPWIQAMRVWSETMAAFMPGSPMANAWMNPYMQGTAATAQANARSASGVSMQVTASVPTDVALDFDASGAAYPVRVAPLVHDQTPGTCAPIVGTEITYTDTRTQVRVAVPDGQPAGLYRGNITDASGARRGEVRVNVQPASNPQQS